MNEKYLPAHVPAPRVFSPQQTATLQTEKAARQRPFGLDVRPLPLCVLTR